MFIINSFYIYAVNCKHTFKGEKRNLYVINKKLVPNMFVTIAIWWRTKTAAVKWQKSKTLFAITEFLVLLSSSGISTQIFYLNKNILIQSTNIDHISEILQYSTITPKAVLM